MGLFSSFKQTQTSVAPPASSPDDANLFRRADLRAYSVGAEWFAAHVQGSKCSEVLPAFVMDFVNRCGDFCTLGAHLERYVAYHDLESEQVRELTDWLPRLQKTGMFISARELRERCVEDSAAPRDPVRIAAIGFPTGGTHERLRRALTSFIGNAREHGRELRFVVADNTPNKAGRTACKQMLRQLQHESAADIFLASEEEKRVFATHLSAAAECDPEIVEFALFDVTGCGFACGANRNALLLHEAGNAFSSVDDDMICRVARSPESASGGDDALAFFSARDAFGRWFYEDRESALRDADFVSADYAGLHEQLLGKNIGSCIADAHGRTRFVKMSDKFLRRLLAGEGRVVMTFTGHIGDPGIPTSYYWLHHRGENLARLTGKSETFYRATLSNRSVRSVMARRSIGDASLSPGMAIGLDARELLPPFPPVLHAEDFAWGATVWQCCGTGFAGHVPFALLHEPGAGRTIIAPGDLETENNRAVIWEFAHILRAFILDYDPPPGESSTSRRMQGLGRQLREIGSAPFGEFVDQLRVRVLQHESDKIEYLEERLARERNAPEFWRADVEHYIEHTRAALRFEDFDVPFDLKKKGGDLDASRRLMQRLFFEFGRLLEAWPQLFETAKALRDEQGITMAAPQGKV